MVDHFEFVDEPIYFRYFDSVDREQMANLFHCSIYENIEERTVAGEDMIFIPKVYVCNRRVDGNPAWFVSDRPKEGYHLHPAFFNNGVETTNGILIGKYPASVEKKDGSFAQGLESRGFYDTQYGFGSVDDVADVHSWNEDRCDYSWYYGMPEDFAACIPLKNSDPSEADSSGWHLFNIYEHALLQRLAFIPTVSPELGLLYQPFGLVFALRDYVDGEWIYGAGIVKSGDNWYWRILNNTQSAFVDTTASIPFDLSWIIYGQARYLHEEVGGDYDMRDLFLPSEIEEVYYDEFPADKYFGLERDYWLEELSGTFCPYVKVFDLKFSLQITNQDFAAFGRLAKFC